jgi:hypothetical protein
MSKKEKGLDDFARSGCGDRSCGAIGQRRWRCGFFGEPGGEAGRKAVKQAL